MSPRIEDILEQVACPLPSAEALAVNNVAAADASQLGKLAILLFRLQLFNLGKHAVLAGRSIGIDDGILLAPNPHRALRASAVSALIPDGINVSSLLSVLDEEPTRHLIKAVALVAQAEQRLVAVRQRAQLHLDEFVAALGGSG